MPRAGITPACAGSTIILIIPSNNNQDHPRLRGEYAGRQSPVRRPKGSPPLARGVHIAYSDSAVGRGITPACAGSTLITVSADQCKQDHPRLRGEYISDNSPLFFKPGSPPLARGVLYNIPDKNVAYRITPACAGSTHIKSVL